MKKSTVLILFIVFVGSVLAVGLFGMRSVPPYERIPIEEIYFTSITTSLKDPNFQGDLLSKIQQEESGQNIYLPFEEGMTVFVGYAFNPADATNKTVNIEILYSDSYKYEDNPYFEVDDRFVITFHNIAPTDLCSIRLEYHPDDPEAGVAYTYLWITVVGEELKPIFGM